MFFVRFQWGFLNCKQSTEGAIKTFLNGYVNKFVKIYKNCGETIGSFTITMHLLSFVNFSVLCQKSYDWSLPVSLLYRSGSPRFFLFPKLKLVQKGRHCDTIVDIKTNWSEALRDISKETPLEIVCDRIGGHFEGDKDQWPVSRIIKIRKVKLCYCSNKLHIIQFLAIMVAMTLYSVKLINVTLKTIILQWLAIKLTISRVSK